VPTNGSVFFTIFQTFLSGDGQGYFGQYPKDFFDLVIIDECHRGGANDESNWHTILEYFDGAVQLGMTATPKRQANIDTYNYFGKPVYEYSLKTGIDDGFLTPFHHVKMQSNIDDYIYTPEDDVVSGDVETGKVYKEADFYFGKIEIKERDMARVKEFMKYIKDDEKTLVFCYTQNHAAQIRDMINQVHHGNPIYCVRVTANDGAIGEQYLADFQDNEKTIPTVLTTSQKLSTGVDARNIRNIVLLRPVNSMIEFKQIVGRGTRIYEGKYFFTIYDFVKAYEHFKDSDWDGEPVCSVCGNNPCTCKPHVAKSGITGSPGDGVEDPDSNPYGKPCPVCGQFPCVCPKPEKLVIKLSDGHTRQIKHIRTDMFWGADGKPVSVEEFLNSMFGKLPEFFTSADDLKLKWSNPETREALLNQMAEEGYGTDVLKDISAVIDAENSDLLDVLEYIAYNIQPIARATRAAKAESFKTGLFEKQKDFIDFVIRLYVNTGVEELGKEKLPEIISMKYGSIPDGINVLGGVTKAKDVFWNFQKALYI
jgi:type I restriction enzyme R subunit